MSSMLKHVTALWGPRWMLPGGLPLLYVAVVAAIGDLRFDHLVVACLACFLAYTSQRTKSFFLDVLPYLVVAIGYDMVRYPREALLRPDGGCV